MTDNTPLEQVQMAALEPRRGLNPIWFLPLLAIAIGGWLFWKSLVEADIPIQIQFPSGAGIVAGKTEVKYQGITLGTVKDLQLAKAGQGVIATVDMARHSSNLLRSKSRFWLVKPEIGFAGIQGLDTLLSGNYIAIQPGEGARTDQFVALRAPLTDDVALDGLILTLKAPTLGSLNIGSPLLFNQLRVGEIVSYQLNSNNDGIDIKVHISPEYEQLVNAKTRFWNSSGFEFKGGVSGFKLTAQSLASLAIGGISFGNPAATATAGPVDNYKTFRLYPDHESAETGIHVSLHVPSADGLQAGITEVRYKGLTAGKVRDIKVNDQYDGVIADIVFDPRMEFAINDSTRFWVAKPQISLSEISGIATLLSGSYIEFDFEASDTPQKEFTALPQAPALRASEPGLHLTLQATQLAGLERGTPITYLQVPIGTVQDYRFSKDQTDLLIDIYIEDRYRTLINPQSRFYNAGGIRLNAGLRGVKLETESLATIIRGGVSIYNPEGSKPGRVANDSRFKLYASPDAARENGIDLTLTFARGDGIQPGTPINYHGLQVGEVTQVTFAENLAAVTVHARLQPAAATLARAGSRFWVARPQLSLTRTENLQTLISGVFIDVIAGDGEARFSFAGLDAKPLDADQQQGLRLVVQTRDLDSLSLDAPVLYRNLPVGKIDRFELASDARRVNIQITIEPRYAPLVRVNSRFWNVSGLKIDAGLFSGINVSTGTLQTLVAGGIAFATPDEPAAAADINSHFELAADVDPLWLQWQPEIKLDAPAVISNTN